MRVAPGYVYTDHNRNGCNGQGAWYHQLPREGVWVCSGSPVPPGYRTTDHNRIGCNGQGAWYLVRA
ncbi:hypothetical protein [Streptomyces sp. SAJ15]|uniref:hypothetical protein n=1 Tax=Streptomyces sp. SAJ15 TaxID=2011095 RepID=UPI00135E1817|nr:hypothetical protein [Streptomyces sp. SAJ15]TVL91358.1 hypothetical protein CD790_15400 [Streptomyces sp. SAJ15]